LVQALVKIEDNTNRVLNVVKAKYCLADKGEAINFVVQEYISYLDEPELQPKFIDKMKKIQKQKSIRVNDFVKRYGLNKDV